MVFLKIILTAAILTTLVSCGGGSDRESARHSRYDLSRSEALIAAGEAFLAEDAHWEELAHSSLLGERLTGILQDDVSRRELFLAANALLQQERLNDLAALIDEAEKRGEATPALLELRGLPRALQALSLFCARRPYQKSQDLEQSLNFLSPWCDELVRLAPETFPPFLESQNVLLKELQEQEKREKIQKLQRKFCHLVMTKGAIQEHPSAVLAEIAGVDESAEILGYLSLDLTMRSGLKEALMAGRWSEPLELASFVCWNFLDEAARGAIGQALKEEDGFTLAAQVLMARLTNSADAYLEAVFQWQRTCPESEITTAYPSFLEEALGSEGEEQPILESPALDFRQASEIFLRNIP